MAFGISTLGPCADALGLSVMMVFCVGVAQLPVMIGLAMHVPAVRVDVYWPYMDVAVDPSTNQSAVILPSQGIHRHQQSEGSSTAALQMQACAEVYLLAKTCRQQHADFPFARVHRQATCTESTCPASSS